MKKLFTLLLALLLITGCSSASTKESKLKTIKEKGEIVVAISPDYAPYEFMDATKEGQDRYVGADVELAKYIADKLGVKLVIKPLEFKDIAGAVSMGKYDIGISGFTYSEERAEQVVFSKTYDTTESTCQGFLIDQSTNDQYKSLEDFKGKTVAVQSASLQEKYVNEEIPESNKKLVAQLDDAVIQLSLGKVDAVAISCSSGETFINAHDNLIIADVKFEASDDQGTKVIGPKGDTELIEEINKIIEEMLQDNLYTQWMNDALELAKELGV